MLTCGTGVRCKLQLLLRGMRTTDSQVHSQLREAAAAHIAALALSRLRCIQHGLHTSFACILSHRHLLDWSSVLTGLSMLLITKVAVLKMPCLASTDTLCSGPNAVLKLLCLEAPKYSSNATDMQDLHCEWCEGSHEPKSRMY